MEDNFLDREKECRKPEVRRKTLDRTLARTLELAWNASPAYRQIYSQAGVDIAAVKSKDDLPLLPVIRMQDLIDRQKNDPPFGGFLTVPPQDVRRVYVNPGLIWQPGEAQYSDSSWAEGMAAAGFRRGDKVVNTFNYHLWPYAFMLDESARMVGATIVPTGVGNTLMQVKIMQQLGINAFLGTPSFLNTLIQRAEGLGMDLQRDLSLTKAMVGAEMLPESLRRRLENRIGLTIRQTYGTVFLGCLGYECSHLTGLHVPEDVIVEVVDPGTGKPVPDGVPGEIVATKFSPVYPLLRFATGDLSLFSRDTCPCGRTGPMLQRVLGRIDQATKVRGTFVHPFQTDGLMARFPRGFQIPGCHYPQSGQY